MGKTLIVGAGVVGLMCAYELHKRGDRVMIVDQGAPGAECSSGNAGWIVPSHAEPLPGPGLAWASMKSLCVPASALTVRRTLQPAMWRWLWSFWRHCNARAHHAGAEALAALARPTMDLYDRLAVDGVHFDMARSGVLWIFVSQASLDATMNRLEAMPDGTAHVEVVSGTALRQAEPALSGELAGGVLIKTERYLRPEAFTAALLSRLQAWGVEIRPGVRVIGLQRIGPRITGVVTEAGTLAADNVLIAAGVWSGTLLRQVGLRLPMRAAKGYSITIQHPALHLRRPLYLAETKIACSPFRDALRIAGTVDLSAIDSTIDPRRVAAMRHTVGKYLEGWDRGAAETTWMGMRPIVPDGLPVIGRIPGYDNLYVATGHAKLGITLAPATAVAIADLMSTGQTPVALRPFNPNRFSPGPRPDPA